jgi:hypothetical protein
VKRKWGAVTPAFIQMLRTATLPELLALVQELKVYAEDRPFLEAVKTEMRLRLQDRRTHETG